MLSSAFVTPTFLPDLKRCELLVQSLDRSAPDIKHYLLVDSFEIKHFKHLRSERTEIIPAEDVIGIAQFRLPLWQNFWIHRNTLPMRGWIRQQILKMAATMSIGAEFVTCVDSDVLFVRPFSPELLLEEGRVGLLDVDYVDGMVDEWTNVAEHLLGLGKKTSIRRGHVGHLITWSRTHMHGLVKRLTEISGREWQVAIGRQKTFSEYILYGVYIRNLLGYDRSAHVSSRKALVRQPWDFDLSQEKVLEDYISNPEPDNVAVMLHSKFNINVEKAREIYTRWYC